ncbi:hypothetical protein O181_114352 [Austropuccinia psidii MF-1]|uniref:Uncharacterized protein n=1 Tax=Austropuccinia psidii MF-1 TaxID=1389203 RepID=A0A9Q3K7E2_9BASI|nr:hypothetical protein [Austropuccinia psidii MF-1]
MLHNRTQRPTKIISGLLFPSKSESKSKSNPARNETYIDQTKPAKTIETSFSLIGIIRQRHLDTIQSVKPSNGRRKILVLDKHSQSLINGVLKTFEILELGVQQIDLIENNQNPTPNLDVVYILAPIA